jgi:hypothetical protein
VLERILAFRDPNRITAYANVDHLLALSRGLHEDVARSLDLHPWKDTGGFLEVGLASDSLHLGVAETTRIREDGKRIALQTSRRKDVDLHEMKAARVR